MKTVFTYERITDGRLQLLSAIPREWYGKGFSAKGIGYSGGKIDIESDGEIIEIAFENKTEAPVEVVFRAKGEIEASDITLGGEYIEKFLKNRVILKSGLTRVKLCIKNKKHI